MLIVYTFRLLDDLAFADFLGKSHSYISQKMIDRAKSYKFLKDQQRTLMGELLVRHFYNKYLDNASLEFDFNEHGKPFLIAHPEHHFNISHSGDNVVAAFSDDAVGIDVEKIGKDRRNIAKRFFTEEEINDMNTIANDEKQIEYFYRLWTLKESYMKAIGGGMTMSLSSFAFEKVANSFKLRYSKYDKNWIFYSQKWEENAFLSICSKSREKAEFHSIKITDLI